MMNSERLVLAAENMLEDIKVQQKTEVKNCNEKMDTSDATQLEKMDTSYDSDTCRNRVLDAEEGYVKCIIHKFYYYIFFYQQT